MTAAALDSLPAGDQLGHLEYVIDDDALAAYRELVGSVGHYPNLLADDCRALLLQRCGNLPLTTIRRDVEFMRPPIPGRRIQVGGWLRETAHEDGAPRLRVAAFAVDEIGTEIMRSETVFRVQQRPELDRFKASPLMQTSLIGSIPGAPACPDLDRIRFGDALTLGSLVLPDNERLTTCRRLGNGLSGLDLNDDGHDLTPAVVGWLEASLGGWFGDDFRWGGRISLARSRPVNAGSSLDGIAVVIERNVDDTGAIAWRLAISASHEFFRSAVAGEATIITPSPRTL